MIRYINDLKNKIYRVGLALICTTAAQAQDQIEDLFSLSPAELAEIPVSIATGTAKPVFRSASVTTVITAQQITRMGATQLHEVLETVPGLHATLQPVTNDYVYTLRGIPNGTGAQILMLMDGVRINVPYKGSIMSGMEIPVEAIQRIEVIRGPGSALYGADAFAGVINIITKKAGDIDGVVIGGRVGSSDRQSGWGQVGGSWAGWDVAASVQYSHDGIDNDRVITADLQSKLDSSVSQAPGPMQTQGERWNAHLNLKHKYVKMGFWAFSGVDQGLRAGSGGSLDKKGRVNNENYLADVQFSTEDLIDNWELRARMSYLSAEVDIDAYNFPSGAVLPIDGNGHFNASAPLGFVSFPDGMRSQLTFINKVPRALLTAIYKGWESHLLRFSAGYRYEEFNSTESRNFGPGVLSPVPGSLISAGPLVDVTGTANVFLSNHHRDIWSFVLQDEWEISPDWQLTTGVRYDEYSDFGTTFNPRVALVWDVNSQLTTKLLYGEAFRAPSFLEQYQQNSPFFSGNPGLRPEEMKTIELAFDYRPMSTLRTALNVYYYKITDSIVVDPDSAQLTVINSKGQEGYGSELEWSWQFHKDWHLKGNYSWQNARNLSLARRVAGVPEHQVYSALAWSFLPDWQIQTQMKWIGRRVNLVGDTRPTLKDYETFDVTLNGKNLLGFMNVTASVRNLFDSTGREPSDYNAYSQGFPIERRNFYLEMKIKF